MALLSALLEAHSAGETNHKQEYDDWSTYHGMPISERKALALARLYNILHYDLEMGTDPSKALGKMLATLMQFAPIPTPDQEPKIPVSGTPVPAVPILRAKLRTEMIKELGKLVDEFPVPK